MAFWSQSFLIYRSVELAGAPVSSETYLKELFRARCEGHSRNMILLSGEYEVLCHCGIPFGDHPLILERYGED